MGLRSTVAATDSGPLPRAYWRQWTASLISNLGDGINFVAMPLLALTLTDDPRLLALTTFAIFLPWLLIGLPAGVMVDRFDRRRLMVCANVIRVAPVLARSRSVPPRDGSISRSSSGCCS